MVSWIANSAPCWAKGLAGLQYNISASGADLAPSGADALERTARTLNMALWAVGIAVGILAVIYLALKIRNELARGAALRQEGDPTSSTIDSALRSERKGDFMKAAMNYEALGDKVKAAEMYAKGKEFTKAAEMYEALGDNDSAVTMYRRSGESIKAAAVYMRAKNYSEAAKIFKNKGDTLRAAQAFEMMGNKMAAAREYAIAGQYIKAARMFKDERMFREAGEVYKLALGDEPKTPANLGKHYTYAAFLVMAGQLESASETYREIASVDASFRDVQDKIRLIDIRMGKVADEPELALDRNDRKPAAPAPEPTPTTPDTTESHDESAAAAALEELSTPVETPAEPEAPVAPTAPPASEEPEPEPIEQPMDETVPSTRVETAPSVDASMLEGEDGVLEQGEIDDLFDQVSGEVEEQPAEEVDALHRETTLRSILNSGRMEPRYSMRMWMQILKKLYEKHSSGIFYGSIPPESIHIDMENNVRLDAPGAKSAEYTAPEVLSGDAPDEQSDIYAMGVVLYEMVTGSLATMDSKFPVDLYDDVPEWMDEMIMRSIEKDRHMRYRGLDDISSLVLQKSS